MATFTFPSAAELHEIEQEKIPVLVEDDPLFQLFPIESVDAPLVMWEQKDNYQGLQQVRGLNGQPPKVTKAGLKRYKMEPGVYGEHQLIDEEELTQRRAIGTFNQPVSLNDLVMQAQDHLLNRRIDRIRANLWTVLSAGTFSVYGANGQLMHSDTFPLQTASASVAWATVATAAPIGDFRALKLKQRAKGVSFGRKALAFMNTKYLNYMLNNTNAADIGGRRIANGSNYNSLADVNAILLANDLPQIVEYDEGYLDDTGTFVPFCPDNKVVVVGARNTGVRVGKYQMTRNAVSGSPGAYTKVIDRSDETVPPIVEVHDGHNGGPAIEFPGSVVILTV